MSYVPTFAEWERRRTRPHHDHSQVACPDCGATDPDAHEKWCIELRRMQQTGAAYVARRTDGSAR
jgi:hypothetical protein